MVKLSIITYCSFVWRITVYYWVFRYFKFIVRATIKDYTIPKWQLLQYIFYTCSYIIFTIRTYAWIWIIEDSVIRSHVTDPSYFWSKKLCLRLTFGWRFLNIIHSKRFIFHRTTKENMYARGESNPNLWNRNPLFYPLNYGRIRNIWYKWIYHYKHLRTTKIQINRN